jgi:hypothetical protein
MPRVEDHPLYSIWCGMKNRCYNRNEPTYPYYGGRGITVCEDWRLSFAFFWADMGPRPSPRHSLDRIDNDGPYSPDNCRWATRSEQSGNRRNNITLTHNGETTFAKEWARRVGLSYETLLHRLDRGWSAERALTTPARAGNYRRKVVGAH